MAEGLVYDAAIEAVAVAAAQDLYEILVPADAVGSLVRLTVEQSDITTSEMWRITVKRVTGSPTSGSGGGTITPRPKIPGAPAAGGTYDRNNTTRLSGGTSVTLLDRGFNILQGFEWAHIPGEDIQAAPNTRLVIGLETTPGTTTTVSAVATFSEIGG